MSGYVGCVIFESDMVENVRVAAGTASSALSVQESFPLPGYSPPFWAPVVAHFVLWVGLLSRRFRMASSDEKCVVQFVARTFLQCND